jgi:hypothetical protein
MRAVGQRARRAAAEAEACAVARDQHRAAEGDAAVSYDRLQASAETIEYQVGWNVARREEAGAAWRLKQAEDVYRAAGGYVHNRDELGSAGPRPRARARSPESTIAVVLLRGSAHARTLLHAANAVLTRRRM